MHTIIFQIKNTTITDVKCELPCTNPNDDVRILNQDEIEIMNLRVNHSVKYLCPNHYKDNFQKYSGWYKKCCDPCLCHKKPQRSLLEVISLKFAQKVFQYKEYRIIIGKKICKSCKDFLN